MGTDPETMRAQAIRLHCLGTRQFLWHGVYQTDGRDDDPTPFSNPRFDFGPGINFEPWWSYHDLFAEETARISAFIEGPRPARRLRSFIRFRPPSRRGRATATPPISAPGAKGS